MSWPTPPPADDASPTPSPWRPVREPATEPAPAEPGHPAGGHAPTTDEPTAHQAHQHAGEQGRRQSGATWRRRGAQVVAGAMATGKRAQQAAGGTQGGDPSGSGRRRVSLAAGGVAGAALLAGAVYLGAQALSGSGDEGQAGRVVVADVKKEPESKWTYAGARGDGSSSSAIPDGEHALILEGHGALDARRYEIVSLDLSSGKERWRTQLDGLGKGDSQIQVLGSAGGVAVLEVTTGSTADDGSYSTRRVYQGYATADGRKRWEYLATDQEQIRVLPLQDAAFLLDETGVARVDPKAPGDEPLWQVPGAAGIADGDQTMNEYVLIQTPEGTVPLSLESGEEAAWFDAAVTGVGYAEAGGDIYRFEESGSGSFVEKLDGRGKADWSLTADEVLVTETPSGDPVVLTRSGSQGGAYLMRINPRDGKEMWDEEVLTTGSGLRNVLDDSFAVSDGSTTDLLSLKDGELVGRLPGVPDAMTGESTYYSSEDGRLSAYDQEGERRWTIRTGDGQTLFRSRGNLVTYDPSTGRMMGWS